MTTDGETIKSFTYNAFQEPVDVAVDTNYGHILVADNGMNCVYIFDAEGKMLFQVCRHWLFTCHCVESVRENWKFHWLTEFLENIFEILITL